VDCGVKKREAFILSSGSHVKKRAERNVSLPVVDVDTWSIGNIVNQRSEGIEPDPNAGIWNRKSVTGGTPTVRVKSLILLS
jgi:hypothetical protein